jgi:uncharacterized membrane protein YphA (DoxX/SURF4 family)
MQHAPSLVGGKAVAAAPSAVSPSRQAWQILRLAFVVAPVVSGFDKFFDLLVNWDKYLAPFIANLSPIGAHGFMQAVGVIEIIAGIGVALKPRIFGYVVAAWLLGIVGNLLLTGYYDIALRDFGLALGALALARLSVDFDRSNGDGILKTEAGS